MSDATRGDSDLDPNQGGTQPPDSARTPSSPNDAGQGADASGKEDADGDAKWAALRALLVSPEEKRLEKLEQEPPASQPLAKSLPAAIQIAAEEGDELAGSLRKTIETGLLQSARNNPDQLAEAIYPVLGPAIKRSIRATLQASLQSLNVALENSLSPQGIRWRIEAARTGKPFSEVVLLHSLEYRVEQVYWIHKQTGLLLQDASSLTESQKDPELVSGMLAAIQDFVQDSFEGAEEGALEQIEVSGFRVLLAQGAQSGLAALVRGIPPESLADELTETLETLQRRYADSLDRFAGDVEPFVHAEEELQGLLVEQVKEKRGKSRLGLYAIGGVAALLLGGWLWSSIATHRMESRREHALAALQAEPGYWVQGGIDQDAWSGLRDPLARPPAEVVGESFEDLDVTFHWKPVQSLDPEIVQRRALALLSPPEGVQLAWPEPGVLELNGEASTVWIRQARGIAPSLPGVDAVRWQGLIDRERQEIERRVQSLDGLYLPFGLGSSVLDTARPEVIGRLQSMRALDGRVLTYGGVVRVELQSLLGVDEPYDRALAQRRLDAVRQALTSQGLQCTIVQARPVPDESGANASRPGVRLGVRAILTHPTEDAVSR